MVVASSRIMEEYALLITSGAVLEVAAYPKPGNVHRLRDFSDIWFEDFLLSSHVILLNNLKAIKRGLSKNRGKYSIGDLIYDSLTRSMRIHGGGNTCLGIALILHPLAFALGVLLGKGWIITSERIAREVPSVLREYTTPYDTIMFYRAVRKANPSYIRETDDTGEYPNVWDRRYREKIIKRNINLYDVLSYSSSRDIVAREIVGGYRNVLEAKRYLEHLINNGTPWNLAVVRTFLRLGSMIEDTVVSRTLGYSKAREVMQMLSKLSSEINERAKLLKELYHVDEYFASKGIRLGAIADLVSAMISLYAIDKKRNIIHGR